MKGLFYQHYFLCVFVILAFNCSASNYYFSANTGDDNRSAAQAQNPSTPWQTINKLNAIFSDLLPGDTIFFKRGETFDGGLIISRSGGVIAPIVLTAYGDGEKPIINGFQVINHWTEVGNGIYESDPLTVGSAVNMVVINGVNYAMGRYPNAEAQDKGYLYMESHESNSISDIDLPASPIWTGAELVMRSQRWILDRAPILDQVGQTLHYDPNGLDYSPSSGDGYFIQNDIKTLDQFGEWYYNPDNQKLSVYFGTASITDQEVLVALEDNLVAIEENHIRFENLNFSGANEYGFYNKEGSFTNIVIRNCDFSFCGIDAIHSNFGNNLLVENCSINHSNNNAIYLSNGCLNSTIRSNTITNTGRQAGMGQSGDGNYIALYNRANGFTAEYNTIINTGYIGINFNGSNTLIKNNYIDTFCMVKDDGGGIYSYVGSINNTSSDQRILGNIILNGLGAPEGTTNTDYSAAEGIYLDENVNHVELLDNTVAHCANHGIFIHNARDFIVNNNTLYDNRIQFSTNRDAPEVFISGGEVTENIFFAKDPTKIAAFFVTLEDDIGDIGTLDHNYYARPLDDDFTIETETFSNSNNYIFREHDLTGWVEAFGLDQNSNKSPISISTFIVDSLGQTNSFANSSFSEGIGDPICWSPINNCNTTLNTSNVLDGEALEINTNGETRLMLEIGELDSEKQYLLRFSARAQKGGRAEIFFREGSPTWNVLSSSQFVKINQDRTEYELLFSNPVSSNIGNIEFFTENENFTYWLDNVELFEVKATKVDPDEYIRFEYNPTSSPFTIPLDTSFIDVKNTPYTGSLTLAPFSSAILMVHDVISSVLPVELSRFYSKSENCEHNAIHWTAEVEENFSHYELEKSLDGISFEMIYQTKSESFPPPVHYKFLDTNPNKQNYYRLKMVDRDGSISYSDIISQQTDCPGAIPEWKIYPNPVRDSSTVVNIQLYTQNRMMHLKLVDQNGRVVKQLRVDTNIGWNTISWPLGGLIPGVYFIYDSGSLNSKALRLLVTK